MTPAKLKKLVKTMRQSKILSFKGTWAREEIDIQLEPTIGDIEEEQYMSDKSREELIQDFEKDLY